MTDWQPIETAPKDQDIIVWDGGAVYTAWYSARINRWLDENGEGVSATAHWIPLPKPPSDDHAANPDS